MADSDIITTDFKPQQKVTVEDVGPARKGLTIEIPEERINDTIKQKFSGLATEAVVPGFRRGRAPMRLLERKFNSAVRDEVRGQLLSESYTQAIEDEKLEVLGEPEIKDLENIKLPDSGPLTFKVEVEISPTVTLPELTSIEIKKPKMQVNENAVAEEIEKARERSGKLVPATDTAIHDRDFVLADVRIVAGETEDGEEISQHPGTYILVRGKEEDYRGQVAGILVEDLGKRLHGKKVGDTTSIHMTGPSSHENERIKDQKITIVIKINQIERLEPASIAQLLEQIGLESEDQLKERIKQMLEGRRDREQRGAMHEQLSEHLLEKTEFVLPSGLTSRQTERVLQRKALDLAYRGVPEAEIQQRVAELRSESEETVQRQLKLFFIINQAAKDLNVEVTEAEVNSQVAMLAMQQGRRPEKLRQQMLRSGELDQLYVQAREMKTLDKILESAKIEEVDALPEKEGEDKPKKSTTKKKSSKKKSEDA